MPTVTPTSTSPRKCLPTNTRLTDTSPPHTYMRTPYPRNLTRINDLRAVNVQEARPMALAEWAEKKLKLLLGLSMTCKPLASMPWSLLGRSRATASFMRLLNWSHASIVRTTPRITTNPLFHPSFHTRNAAMATYRGYQSSLSENRAHIWSVKGECMEFISSVTAWSALSSVLMNGYILDMVRNNTLNCVKITKKSLTLSGLFRHRK